MKGRPVDAMLYGRCDAFARWLLARVRGWPDNAARLLGEPIFAEARALLAAVSLALTFKSERPRHLRAADEALARLRAMVRLTEVHPPLMDDIARAEAAEQLTAIGRILGGWRKRLGRGDALGPAELPG